ncbi:MAG: hypothetical protein M1826_007695 [Phylliscum demangeonii]|nr:MAG: hypothetical protein M1826_007695 [Phylliscum demangeonii]
MLNFRRLAMVFLAALPLASAACPQMQVNYDTRDHVFHFTRLPQIVKIGRLFSVRYEVHVLPTAIVRPQDFANTAGRTNTDLCGALYRCGAYGMRADIEKHTSDDHQRCLYYIHTALEPPGPEEGVSIDQYRANVANMIQNQYNNWIRVTPAQLL